MGLERDAVSAPVVRLSAAEINAQMARYERHLGAQVAGPAVVSIAPFPAMPERRGSGPTAEDIEWLWEGLH